MPKPREHIEYLFANRGRDDPNSTTLSNTLNKDIETVFNSHEKFVFELLQNADDAGLQEIPLDVHFIVRNKTLIFTHNGKHFDYCDVESICDNAQQKIVGKKLDIDKTGYKGIGFKSVFVITDCVHILSQEYSFRFDRNFVKWQQHEATNPDGRYPWQIIPVWTVPAEYSAGLRANIDPARVNFIFSIRDGIDIRSILSCILSNPQVILFLRRTQMITFDLDGEKHEIRLERTTSTERNLYLNQRLKSKWRIFEAELAVPAAINAKIQHLGPHECPEKLKIATKTNLTFAVLLTDNKLTPLADNVLHCYLPTKVQCGLPFLVNADFLLSADRTQLLENIWNIFLFDRIARLHLQWLQILAQDLDTRDQILAVFTAKLTGNMQQMFADQYSKSIEKSYLDIAFIPPYLGTDRLLLLADAMVDETGFYQNFPELVGEYGKSLVRYELKYRSKLPCIKFDLSNLSKKITYYMQTNKDLEFQTKIYKFLMERYDERTIATNHTIKRILSVAEIVLTKDNSIVAPSHLFLPTDNVVEYPTCLDLKLVDQEILKIPGLNAWLLALDAKLTRVDEILDKIITMIRSLAHKITATDSLEIILFLYKLYVEKNLKTWTLHRFQGLPLLTESGKLQLTVNCYLASRLLPRLDLQEMLGGGDMFVSERYLQKGVDPKLLGELLKAIGVQETIEIQARDLGVRDRIPGLDQYDMYCDSYRQHFFGSTVIFKNLVFISFMHCLPNPNYAKFFWQLILQKWDHIYEYSRQTKLYVASKTRSNSYDLMPYLNFYLTRNPCLLATDDKLHTVHDLYCPVLLEGMGEKLAKLLLHMQPYIKLNRVQSTFFGFKQTISAKDYIKLLDFAMTNDGENLVDNYTRIFAQMLETQFSSEELAMLRQWPGKFLATDHSLQPKSALWFCNNNTSFKPTNTSALLCSLPELDMDQMLKICKIFAIKLLQPTDFIPKYTNAVKDLEFSKYLIDRLPIWAMFEAYRTKKDKAYLLKTWHIQMQKCTLYSVENLEITTRVAPEIQYNAKIYFNGEENIYFIRDRMTKQRILDFITDYLTISTPTIAFVMETCDFDMADLLEWLQEKGYELTAIPEIDDTERRLEEEESYSATAGLSKADSMEQPVLIPATAADSSLMVAASTSVAVITDSKKRRTLTSQSEDLSEECGPAGVACDVRKFSSAGPCAIRDRSIIEESSSSEDELSMEIKADGASAAIDRKRHIDQGHVQVTSSELVGLTREIVSKDWVGRWGEELVFVQLRTLYRNKYPNTETQEVEGGFILIGKDNVGRPLRLEVIWLNKDAESGAAADFKIIKNGKERCIEVKSSYHASKSLARVSRSEWELMRTMGKNYSLFFVYNAGSSTKARVVTVKDPAAKIATGELKPYEIQFKI